MWALCGVLHGSPAKALVGCVLLVFLFIAMLHELHLPDTDAGVHRPAVKIRLWKTSVIYGRIGRSLRRHVVLLKVHAFLRTSFGYVCVWTYV